MVANPQLGKGFPLSPALSACMMARIQCASTPKHWEASSIKKAPELDAAVWLFGTAFPTAAASEHERKPGTAIARRRGVTPTKGK
jgi:hypothetical protein